MRGANAATMATRRFHGACPVLNGEMSATRTRIIGVTESGPLDGAESRNFTVIGAKYNNTINSPDKDNAQYDTR